MSFFDSLIGFAPYAEGMVQRHDQRALQTLAQQRQAMLDKQNADLAQANIGHLNAEAGEAGARATSLLMPKMPPVQRIDPLSPEGVQAAITRAQGSAIPKPVGAPVMGSPDWLKAQEALEKLRAKYRPPPAAPGITYLTGGDPKDPHIFAGTTRGTPTLTDMGVSKPTAQGGGSQSLAPEDRQKMLNQAKIDNATMKAYENKVMQSGQAPGFAAGAAGIAASAAPTGIVGGIAGLIGNKATGAIDPDYQRYITAQRSYGRIMGNLQSKRYTDHQAEIERSISGLQGNDLNTTIQYKQQLRDASLAGDDTPPTAAPKSAKSSGPIDLGAPSGPAKPQSYEEWKKSKGITP